MAELLSELSYEASLAHADTLLYGNGYPGRWLAIGRGKGTHEAELFLAYSFGGRSEGSKNRAAIYEGDAIRLVAPGMDAEQMSKVPDAALVYYHAMDTEDNVYVVSNGAQTRPVLEAVVDGASFEDAVTDAPTEKGAMNGELVDIDLSSFEPDSPINTPRITAAIDLRDDAKTPVGMAVVRKDPATGQPVRSFYTGQLDDLEPGFGWAIQTYGRNNPQDRETPVPSFGQAPYGFSLVGETVEIAARIQAAIGEETFAAAVVRAIDIHKRQFNGSTIINTRG